MSEQFRPLTLATLQAATRAPTAPPEPPAAQSTRHPPAAPTVPRKPAGASPDADPLAGLGPWVEALEANPAPLPEDYDTWVRVGLALTGLGEPGRELFHRVSRLSSKYDKSKCDAKFSELLQSRDGRISPATFVAICKEYGVTLTRRGSRWAAGRSPGTDAHGPAGAPTGAPTAAAPPPPTPAGAVPHGELLAGLLRQVGPVNFRALAQLPEGEKVTTKHFVMIVVRELLALAERNSWGLCRREGSVHAYNGAYWLRLESETLKRFLMDVAETMGVQWSTARYHAFGELIEKQFAVSAYLPTANPARDVCRVNLLNGTFEVSAKGQHLRPPNPADFLTHQLPFAYDPAATAPRWEAFLNRVVPDENSRLVLAEYLGYLFVHPSRLKLEKVLLLYGTGANGKSVFFEVVTALLGSENVSNYSLSSLTTEPAYSRAHLATKLVNYASELNGRLEADTFKQIASGEPIEARLPYGQPFILTDYAKLIFNCNELPTEVEHTTAFFRRFLIVPFGVTIPEREQDRTLAAQITANELAGVFNWVLAGLGRLLAQKNFTECEAAGQQLEAFRRQSDSVRLFLDEMGWVADPAAWVPTKTVYEDYRRFCLEDGYKAVAKQKFVARLRLIGVEQTRRNPGQGLTLARRP